MPAIASTSRSAYHSLDLPELELAALEAVESFGINGCTKDEILERFPHFTHETVTPRFAPLERKGFIFRAGDTRMGRSGRQQKVIRSAIYTSSVPVVITKAKKNPFLEGLLCAAKIIRASSDFESAKLALVAEARKVAAR